MTFIKLLTFTEDLYLKQPYETPDLSAVDYEEVSIHSELQVPTEGPQGGSLFLYCTSNTIIISDP